MEKQSVPKRQVWKAKDEMLKNVCNIKLHKSLMFSPSSTQKVVKLQCLNPYQYVL